MGGMESVLAEYGESSADVPEAQHRGAQRGVALQGDAADVYAAQQGA